MASQYVVIGITIGVFFAGLGMGYAIFSQNTSANFMNMTPQQMQQMMNNPQAMNDWMSTMMQNPNAMNQWMGTMMENQQFMQGMHDSMMNNPQHMQTMMTMMGPSMMDSMMNDPQTSQQMMSVMMQNEQFMHGMMANPQFQQNWMGPWMSNGTNSQGMMGSGWMNQGMMGTPVTKSSNVLSTINNIENLLDQVSSKYNDGDKNAAFSLATAAYLENYEYVESAIAAKDLAQMEKIEIMLRVDLRHLIQNDESAQKIDAKIDSIKTELTKVKKLFS